MVKTLFKLRFIIPFYFIFFIGLAVIGLVHVDYTLVAPAYNDDISKTIHVPSDNVSEGSFHTTSVISLTEVTILQKFLGDRLPKVDLREKPTFYKNVNTSDLRVRNVLMKDDSIQTSLIVGIEESGSTISYLSYPTVFLTYKHITEDSLLIGDYVLRVNGNEDIFTETSNVACNDSASFEIIRDDEVMTVTATKNEVDDQCTFGISVSVYSEIQSTVVDYEVYDTDTGGPSGGLMQSLYVFNQLTTFDYSNGLKIGGTGTIDVEGNIGYIGGVRQKVITAISNNIDIFFVPYLTDADYDNYIQALATMDEFESDMILVGVRSFDEAVSYLESVGDSNE